MATGTVKWFNETKGYGFIAPDQGGKDVFVHISAVERSGLRGLAEGMKISYDVEPLIEFFGRHHEQCPFTRRRRCH
jgi:cold shock protein